MSVLVAYASRHGATRDIAERISARLREAGQTADAIPVTDITDLSSYEGFVIGGAAYFGSWLKETTIFVRRHQAKLVGKPVWLFSSGPLGTETKDRQGRDMLEAAEPKEWAEFKQAIEPRGTRVFYGALDPARLRPSERLVRALPAGRALLPEGDFRQWHDIDAWADTIVEQLAAIAIPA
jgi:menaquinone-dependent protoporphyrinogen oxidase